MLAICFVAVFPANIHNALNGVWWALYAAEVSSACHSPR
jgi:hypothetical protein